MSDNLPREVLISVFLKLPLKSLGQCTCVSKSWHSLVTSPTFIAIHLHQQKTHLLMRQCWVNFNIDRYSLRSDSESLDEIQHLDFPFKSSILNQFFRIIGSCHGLLCLADDRVYFDDTIILWNPMIRKSVTLPCPRFVTCSWYMHLLGFGFDSRTNDYKVVRVAYRSDNGLDWAVPPEVDVYWLSTRSWRQIAATPPPYHAYQSHKSQAYINGAVHWIAYKPEGESKNQYLIMLFDMSNEVFGEMMLPTSLASGAHTGGGCVQIMCIAVLGESLSVFEFNDKSYTSCGIWMMKEYGVAESWTKQFVVNVAGGFGMIFSLRTNGDFTDLLLSSKRGELVSYNPETQQIKMLGIRGSRNSCYLGTYTQSLVLIKAVKGASWERARSCDSVEDNKGPNMPQTEDGVEGSKNVKGSKEEQVVV